MERDSTKKLLFLFGFLSLFCFTASCSTAWAQMSPLEILQKADEARGNLEGIQWDISMDSVENGRKQQRSLRVIAKGYNSFIDTLAPSNVRGQKLLMQDRNMWFAKPGLSKPVPISPRQKLMGSASNGDIAATNYAGDYKIIKTEEGKFNNEACVIMDLQAMDSRATYDKIRYWISRERMVGLKAEFFTVSGKMFKSATFEYENSIGISNQPREFISKMIINSALIKDDVTVIKYSPPVLKKVSDSVFNINLLTR
jgi:outer membrane lipoprotein-sorting protein